MNSHCLYKLAIKIKRLQLYLNTDSESDKLVDKIDSTNITSIDLYVMPYWKRGFYCTNPKPIPRTIFILLNTNDRNLKKNIKEILKDRKVAKI